MLHVSAISGPARAGLATFLLGEGEDTLEARPGRTSEENRTTLIIAGRTKNVSPFPLAGKVAQHLPARFVPLASLIPSEVGIIEERRLVRSQRSGASVRARYEERSNALTYPRELTLYWQIRADPRFNAILARMLTHAHT